jgi:hypothetical protein
VGFYPKPLPTKVEFLPKAQNLGFWVKINIFGLGIYPNHTFTTKKMWVWVLGLGLYPKPKPQKTPKKLGLGKNPNFLVETFNKNYKKYGFLPKPNFFWVFRVWVLGINPKKWVFDYGFWVFFRYGFGCIPKPKTHTHIFLGLNV